MNTHRLSTYYDLPHASTREELTQRRRRIDVSRARVGWNIDSDEIDVTAKMTIRVYEKKHKLDLSTLDGRLLVGLNFCRKVYELFTQTRAGADGIANLRPRPTKLEKRPIEELIPIARYVQARYREGRRIKVRWLSGSQPYDAVLLNSGAFVDKGITPRRILIEVTTSVHPNEYFARQLLNEKEFSFGVEGISRHKKSRAMVSTPYVDTNDDKVTTLTAQIIARIKAKTAKSYPPNTVLIMFVVLNGVTYQEEWNEATNRVAQANERHGFSEVFLIETTVAWRSATSKELQCVRRSRPRQSERFAIGSLMHSGVSSPCSKRS